MENTIYIIGQVLGIVAVILGFISFQMKSQYGIIVMQCATGFVFSAHYFFISAPTAVVLNLVTAFICVFYAFRNKKQSKNIMEVVVTVAIIVVAGLFAWESVYSLLLIAGLALHTISLSLTRPQSTRKLVFFKSPLCFAYNILVGSIGGVIFECVVLSSAIIGLIKNRGK